MAVRRFGVVLGFLALACGGDVGDGNSTGSQGATCTIDSACNPGLVCVQGQCVLDEGDTFKPSGGAGGGAGAGGGTGGAKPAGTGGISQGSGGIVGTGGRPANTGGFEQGGAAGIGGVAGTGGAVIGGTGGATFECTPNDPSLSECDACVHAKCCGEFMACNDALCAGDSTQQGELVCVVACMDQTYADAGVVLVDDLYMCASACAGGSSGMLAVNTDAVLQCMNAVDDTTGSSNCGEVCLGLF